jgi:predicted metal-dependent hydrolase
MADKRSDLKILKLKGREVPLTVRRNPRARRLTLRLDQASGAAHLSLPRGVALAEGLDFARSRTDWILKQLESLPPHVPFAEGARIPYLGELHEIRSAPWARRGVWREAGCIWVSGFAEHLSRRVADHLRQAARRQLSGRARIKAADIGRRVSRVSIRDTRSRWGSCSSDGELNFSWRLILAPEAVLDYVVAHEVAHLVHLNHGPRFWTLVDTLTAEVDGPRRWLRENGGTLLRYG